jgi:hypothetical protein
VTVVTAAGALDGDPGKTEPGSERMANAMTISWRGREYRAERKDQGESGEPGPVWRVLRDGAPLTSFPADGLDDEAAVREKVTSWLEANQSRPLSDVGRQ